MLTSSSFNIFIITVQIQGVNGTFRLYTSGDGGIFEVTPNQGINQVSFLVRVKDPLKLDYERIKGDFKSFNWQKIVEHSFNFVNFNSN